MFKQEWFVQQKRAYIFLVIKANKCKDNFFVISHFCIRNKKQETHRKILNHDQFGHLVFSLAKPHIL